MGKPRGDPLSDGLGILGARGCVERQGIQDEDLPPLVALVQRRQKLRDRFPLLQIQEVAPQRLRDLRQARDGVRDDHRVLIRQKVLQDLYESLVLDELWIDVEHLGDADGRRLSHIGIFVLAAPSEWLKQILGDLVQPDATHRSHCESADQRVRVHGILAEGVDGQDRQLRLRLGVIHDVQVHQLLQLDVVRLDAIHDICEQSGHVLADGHVRDDLLDRILLLGLVARMELLLQLLDLTSLGGLEVLAVILLPSRWPSHVHHGHRSRTEGAPTPQATSARGGGRL
mmetsp:Transcript_69392/g.201331  ORF Transcript_69392/g.201331 Transcript_69392/m.201331 type:complete len:285 (-) Transcript_69392:17-871(-)